MTSQNGAGCVLLGYRRVLVKTIKNRLAGLYVRQTVSYFSTFLPFLSTIVLLRRLVVLLAS